MKMGLIQAGGLVVVLIVINYIYDSARNFWDFNVHRQEIKVVYKRLLEILEAPFEGKRYATSGLQRLDGKIESLRVHIPSFSYNNSSPLLENFKLHAQKGEIVGLFGKSEIGKSTVIKIILGLLAIEKNYVFINNAPLSKIEIGSYYRKVGYLPQHSILFKGTVRENVLLGEDKPLDVEEGGRNLSGGELQRTAIVRTFTQGDKDLYLLDEPTTYLDEMKIRALEELIRRKSSESIILIVSHSRDFLKNLCNSIAEFS